MSALRSVNAFCLPEAVNQTVHSPIIPFDSLPIVRYADGSGFGVRSYPFDVPGYGFGLVEAYPRTTVERLLDNYEIVEAIFDGMQHYEDVRKMRRTMLRLMLTTKAFHHHAAAILWSRLGTLGIQPLLDIVADIRTPEVGYGNGYVQLASSPHYLHIKQFQADHLRDLPTIRASVVRLLVLCLPGEESPSISHWPRLAAPCLPHLAHQGPPFPPAFSDTLVVGCDRTAKQRSSLRPFAHPEAS